MLFSQRGWERLASSVSLAAATPVHVCWVLGAGRGGGGGGGGGGGDCAKHFTLSAGLLTTALGVLFLWIESGVSLTLGPKSYIYIFAFLFYYYYLFF